MVGSDAKRRVSNHGLRIRRHPSRHARSLSSCRPWAGPVRALLRMRPKEISFLTLLLCRHLRQIHVLGRLILALDLEEGKGAQRLRPVLGAERAERLADFAAVVRTMH